MDKLTLYKILSKLNKIYRIKVRKDSPYRILIHGILSARTKDEITEKAEEKLIKKAKNAQELAKLSEKEIENLIYPVNYYRTKAKRLKKVAKVLISKYNGKVPENRKDLLSLPGVGNKIADLILLFGFGKAAIPIDTHVEKIVKRWKIVEEKANYEKIRERLNSLIREKDRRKVNQLLVEFGKEYCSYLPKCYACPVENLCPYEKKNFRTKGGS